MCEEVDASTAADVVGLRAAVEVDDDIGVVTGFDEPEIEFELGAVDVIVETGVFDDRMKRKTEM